MQGLKAGGSIKRWLWHIRSLYCRSGIYTTIQQLSVISLQNILQHACLAWLCGPRWPGSLWFSPDNGHGLSYG
ncbi:hypothetical protein CFter6_1817 [Collimonas fungivorans]|uniref:Uncharacterized protein n=1 Tax=Collimonas fungivorans TaxID=158899 RepID=A0A127PA24_9BURK|nr:hypothetical protein CFter6_1817 [Collimonas fungivorans]